MLALTDVGFASSLVQKLSARDPAKYGPAAEQLKVKADRALQRQREKRQHEKNLREGKKKPWAVPAPAKENAPPVKQSKPARGASPSGPSRDGRRPARPGGPHKPGPGGRKLSGKFRHHP